MSQLNDDKLHQFIGKMLGDLGGAFSVPTARIGLRLGLFDALHKEGPLTADGLAAKAGGLAPRYVREWALARLMASLNTIRRPRSSAFRRSRPWSSPSRIAPSILRARSTLSPL